MQLLTKRTKKDEVRHFVKWWSFNFPLDIWYRRRFDIRFNSDEHRKLNLIDMMFEFEELVIYQEAVFEDAEEKKRVEYFDETGRWLYQEEYSSAVVDEAFDNLDISKLNKE